MEWTFSFGALLVGLLLMAFGALMIVFHQKLADNLASGVLSYGKFKLAGLIFIVVGFIVMINLHTVILTWLVNLIFHR